MYVYAFIDRLRGVSFFRQHTNEKLNKSRIHSENEEYQLLEWIIVSMNPLTCLEIEGWVSFSLIAWLSRIIYANQAISDNLNYRIAYRIPHGFFVHRPVEVIKCFVQHHKKDFLYWKKTVKNNSHFLNIL